MDVSVPIRGLFFLTSVMANGEYPYVGAVFPSLSGDYFFNKVPPAEVIKYIEDEVFPSPLGDYFFN